MRISILLLLTNICFIASGQQDKQYSEKNFFTITCKIKGLSKGDSVYLIRKIDPVFPSDSFLTISYEEKFSLKVPYANGPIFYRIKFIKSRTSLPLFLHNEDVSINGSIDNISNAIIAGSKSQKDFEEFQDFIKPLEEENAMLQKELKKILSAKDDFITNYINRSLDQEYTPLIIGQYVMNEQGDREKARTLYNSLTPRIQNSVYGKYLKFNIDGRVESWNFLNTPATNQFSINVSLTGLSKGDTVLLTYIASPEIVYDTLMGICNENFVKFQVPKREGPLYYKLKSRRFSNDIKLFLESNHDVTISGNVSDNLSIVVQGSKSNEQLTVYTKLIDPLQREEERIKDIIQSKRLNEKLNNAKADYLSTHPTSTYSPILILQRLDDTAFTYKHYNSLAVDIKATKYGKYIKEALDKIGNLAVGKQILPCSLPNLSGQKLDIDAIANNNKLTLIDFWASWCVPCRKETPTLIKLYEEFKDSGLEIVGISFDEKSKAWKEAIEKDKMTWIHLSDLGGWNSSAAKIYNISSLPQNYVIDSTGKILAKNIHGDELYNKIKELLNE